jgi:hypothetical protein
MLSSLQNSDNREARARDRLWVGGNYILAVLLALMSIPYLAGALGSSPLNDSWQVDNYLAVLNHFTFGTRYVWTYGPLGFADTPKVVSRHLLMVSVVLQTTLPILLAALLAHILTFRVHPATATVIIIGLLLPSIVTVGWGNVAIGSIEFMAFLCTLMLLYVALTDREENWTGSTNLSISSQFLVAIAGSLMVIAPLVRPSLLPAALVMAALWALETVRQRSWRALMLFLLPALFLWFAVFALAGGGIASGFRWPVAVLPLITGYTPAMSLQGPFNYLVAAAIVAVATAVCAVQVLLRCGGNWWFVGSVILFWLTAFKEGFVRQDAHVFSLFSLAPWCLFLLWCAICQIGPAPVPSNEERSQPEYTPAAISISAVVACSLCFFILVAQWSTVMRLVPELQARAEGLFKALRFVRSEDYARAELERQEQDILDHRTPLGLAPLVPILRDQRVFSWPWDGNALIGAHAVQVFPPVPHEYSAYTASLDDIDARFFSAPGRPPLGLISVDAIDGRLPLQTAGMSFVQLLSCYHPVALSGSFLVVASAPERSECPRDLPANLKWTAWQAAQLGEWARIPSRPGHITMAQISVELSILGRLMNLGIGSAPLHLSVRTSEGQIAAFRMVHNTLPDGILVSTVLRDASDLVHLWLGAPRNDVEAMALETDRPREWHPTLRMRSLEIPVFDSMARVVRLVRPSGATDHVAHEDPFQGNVDSVKPAQNAPESHWLWVEGWYDAHSGQALDRGIRLAILEAPDRALLVPSYSVPRMDVVRARGPRTPLLCGFAALVPRNLWTAAKGLALLRTENGNYRMMGILSR